MNYEWLFGAICFLTIAIIVTIGGSEYRNDLPCYDNKGMTIVGAICEGEYTDPTASLIMALSMILFILFTFSSIFD